MSGVDVAGVGGNVGKELSLPPQLEKITCRSGTEASSAKRTQEFKRPQIHVERA